MIEIQNNFSSQGLSQIFKCQIHKQRFNSLFLEQSQNQTSPLRCTKCQTTQRLDSSKLLSLEEILECDNKTILDNWPLFGEKNKVFQLLADIPLIDFQEFSEFFKGLRSSFLEQIDRIEQKLISQFKLIEENRKLLESYYNSVSFKDQLQSSIGEYTANPEKSIKELNECIKQATFQRNKVEQDSNYIYKCLSYYQDYLSIQSLETFQNSIKNTLKEMENIINYEIYNLLEKDDNIVVVLPQKQQFQNDVYFGQKSFVYNLNFNTQQQYMIVNNCYQKKQNNVGSISLKSYHQQQNKSSYENLIKLSIIE